MIEHDEKIAAGHVWASFEPIFKDACEMSYSGIAKLCETPIEAMLGTGISIFFHLAELAEPLGPKLIICGQREYEKHKGFVRLVPQFQWENYRIDWAIYDERMILPHLIFLECDGHDYHNLTKEQAQKDRERDRTIQTAGIPIARFTGSEIHRDVSACAFSIIKLLYSRRDRGAA